MDWNKQELEKIEAVMKHLNEIIFITNGTSVKLDAEAEQVHFFSESGKKYKTISVAGDSPLAVAKDVLQQID